MSAIADQIGPNRMALRNESFAATNEREGSEIARQVIRASVEAGIKVVFVTHLLDLAHSLYRLAHSLYRQGMDTALFLRAERTPDGRRTFRIIVGEPLATSYGHDVYARVFGAPRHAATVAARREALRSESGVGTA
jgi:DNA mismatch repair ATPase MutS